MAVATQPVRTQAQARTQDAPQSAAELERVLIQTEEDLAALRARIDDSHPGLSRAVATSTALQRARKLVTQKFLDDYVMPLMNSPLGFMTDKTGAKGNTDLYRPGDLVEPVVEALIRGFNIAGNEMNVISGRFYGAQNGYRRLVREIPGLTDLEEIPGSPVAENGNTSVRFIVRCKINGKEWFLKNEKGEPGRKFTIRVNAGMGPDAILGKAARKALKAAYEELTGTKITESDDPEPKEGAEAAPIPTGRSKIPNGKPAAAVPAELPQENLDTAGGEVPNDPDFDEEVAKQWYMNLADALHEVAAMPAMYKVGEEIEQRRKVLGEKYYAELTGLRQAKSAELLAANKGK